MGAFHKLNEYQGNDTQLRTSSYLLGRLIPNVFDRPASRRLFSIQCWYEPLHNP